MATTAESVPSVEATVAKVKSAEKKSNEQAAVEGEKKRKFSRGHETLDPSVSYKGILITYEPAHKEEQAEHEALLTVGEFLEQLYPRETISKEAPEVEEAKATEVKEESARLSVVDIKAKGALFLRFLKDDMCPVRTVKSILTDYSSNLDKTPPLHMRRLVPISLTTPAKLDALVGAAKEFIPKEFETPENASKKFAVVFEHHNEHGFKREELLKAVGDVVGPNHKVDLTNPDLFILVNSFSGVAGISVVSDYKALDQFNIRRVTEDAAAAAAPTDVL